LESDFVGVGFCWSRISPRHHLFEPDFRSRVLTRHSTRHLIRNQILESKKNKKTKPFASSPSPSSQVFFGFQKSHSTASLQSSPDVWTLSVDPRRSSSDPKWRAKEPIAPNVLDLFSRRLEYPSEFKKSKTFDHHRWSVVKAELLHSFSAAQGLHHYPKAAYHSRHIPVLPLRPCSASPHPSQGSISRSSHFCFRFNSLNCSLDWQSNVHARYRPVVRFDRSVAPQKEHY
jgi:hypothetical protein